MALLEARLTEEKDWRKQLEVDLSAAQAALKKDKEVKKRPYVIRCVTENAITLPLDMYLKWDLRSLVLMQRVIVALNYKKSNCIIHSFSTPKALQIGERELKKLRLEVSSLQTECQQGKTLIKSLTQVKGEKAILEEKVC